MRSFLFMLLCCGGLVQAAEVVSVKSITFVGNNSQGDAVGLDDIKMPFVLMANAKVAGIINDQLFIGQFNAMSPDKPGRVLGAADHIIPDGIRSQEFSVALNGPRVLTIAFNTEGCGAYCENYASYYSFDTRNGHLITADDLLTPAGMRALDSRMKKERVAKYKAQLVQLRTQLKASRKKHGAKASEESSDLEERIALNEDCLEKTVTPETAPGMDAFALNAIELAEHAFQVTRFRCSNHASSALDEVGDVMFGIPYEAMRAYLTSYGKAVLLNDGDTLPTSSPFGQILRGHLANTAVTMLLRKASDNSVSGVYFYDKHRTPIGISGSVSGTALELSEKDDKGVEIAKIKLTNAAGHLKGRWIGRKEFTLELSL